MKSALTILGFALLAIGGCGGFVADETGSGDGGISSTCKNLTVDVSGGPANTFVVAAQFWVDAASLAATTELRYSGGALHLEGGALNLSFIQVINLNLKAENGYMVVTIYDCGDQCMAAGTGITLRPGPIDLLDFIKDEQGAWVSPIILYGKPVGEWRGSATLCAEVNGSFQF